MFIVIIIIFFFRDFIYSSQGRGNSLRNKVRGWVELGSPDPQIILVENVVNIGLFYQTSHSHRHQSEKAIN